MITEFIPRAYLFMDALLELALLVLLLAATVAWYLTLAWPTLMTLEA